MRKLREWIEEEKRYLWIVIFIILFHSTFTLLGALAVSNVAQEEQLSDEDLLLKEKEMMLIIQDNPSLQFLFGLTTIMLIFLLVLGVFFLVQFFLQSKAGKLAIPWRLPKEETPWSLRDVFHVVVLLVLSMYVIEFFQALLFHFLPGERSESAQLLSGTLLTDFIAVLLVLRLVMFQKGGRLSNLGLSIQAFFRNLLFGLRSYLSILPLLFFSLVVSIWLAEALKIAPPPQPLNRLFEEGTSQKIFFIAMGLVIFLGPVIEEIFFRGFLYNALKGKWGIKWAVLTSGFLFAALHANLIAFLPIVLLGCALAYSYELTGSLVASITIHVFHNALVMMLFFLMTHVSQFAGT